MTAKIITIFNQKGGCTKTMTTMQLGGSIALQGKKVLIIDMDRQGTALNWFATASKENPFPAEVVSYASLGLSFINQVAKVGDNYDLILVDCPPAIESPIPWSSLLISDLAVIPFIPTLENIWATKQAKELAMRAMAENKALRVWYLASKTERNNVTKAMISEIEKDTDIPLLKSKIASRTIYAESVFSGTIVHAFSRSSPAAMEVDELAEELLQKLEV
jgi:chromosome partitioning protein